MAFLAVGLSGYYMAVTLAGDLRKLLANPPAIRWGAAFAGLGLMFFCVLLGGAIWRQVLRGVGQNLSWRTCLRSHLLSNLGGYLPGYGWKYMGKAYLVQRAGTPMSIASLAVLLEFAGSAISRLFVVVLLMPGAFLMRFGWHVTPLVPWVVRLTVGVLLLAAPWILQVVVVHLRSGKRFSQLAVRPSALLGALCLMCATWLLHGLAFSLLTASAYDVRPEQLVPLVFSNTSSFLVSLLLFFVPAGLGVRESVVMFTLEDILPAGMSALGAVFGRLALVIAELLGALMGSLLGIRERLCK
jgi:hypothetical protein